MVSVFGCMIPDYNVSVHNASIMYTETASVLTHDQADQTWDPSCDACQRQGATLHCGKAAYDGLFNRLNHSRQYLGYISPLRGITNVFEEAHEQFNSSPFLNYS